MEVTGAAVKTEESPRALRILRPRQPGRKRVDLRFPRKTRPWPIWPQLKESVQFYSASIPPFLPQLFEGKRKRVRVKFRNEREFCEMRSSIIRERGNIGGRRRKRNMEVASVYKLLLRERTRKVKNI